MHEVSAKQQKAAFGGLHETKKGLYHEGTDLLLIESNNSHEHNDCYHSTCNRCNVEERHEPNSNSHNENQVAKLDSHYSE
jgi:hypothetical protein